MVVHPDVVPAPTADPASSGPVRTCVGCRERATKDELLRLVVGSDSHGHPAVVPDPGGGAAGRGAHLHPTTACLDLAVRRKAFARALRVSGGPGLSSAPVAEHLAAGTSTTSSTISSTEDSEAVR